MQNRRCHRYLIIYGPLYPTFAKNAFLPESSKLRLGVDIFINFDLQASASWNMKPFGSWIFVSCSSPVTGFLNDSTSTSSTTGTEKLLFFPSIFFSTSTN